MTDSIPVKTDEDGIPLLDTAVTPQQLRGEAGAAATDLTDQVQVGQLLANEAVQVLVSDLAEDLQKLVAWKVEEVLKEELQKLIHDATERSVPRLHEEIRTHLSLALPELLARIAGQARR